MSDKMVLLINRDGSIHPTGRVLPKDDMRNFPPRYTIARMRPITASMVLGSDSFLAPNIEQTHYRRMVEVGPYVVYEEWA